VDPSATGTSPFLQWPLTISDLDADSKDPIGRVSMWKYGNVAKKTHAMPPA